jgi:hypothetical protein
VRRGTIRVVEGGFVEGSERPGPDNACVEEHHIERTEALPDLCSDAVGVGQ